MYEALDYDDSYWEPPDGCDHGDDMSCEEWAEEIGVCICPCRCPDCRIENADEMRYRRLAMRGNNSEWM